jgi:adenylate cyclase
MGSDARFDYSALGDSVNIASRLQDLTKTYGLQILIGASTAQIVTASFAALAIDAVRMKGKDNLEEIHVLLHPAAHDGAPVLPEFTSALVTLRACCSRLDWVAAKTSLESCRAALPHGSYDVLLTLYEQRVTAGLAQRSSSAK